MGKEGSKYKFSSISIFFSPDASIVERETYGLLEWLGDVGGFYGALRYLGGFLIAPFTYFHLKVKLLSSIFRSIVTKVPTWWTSKNGRRMSGRDLEFSKYKRFEKHSYQWSLFCRGKKVTAYKGKLNKAMNAVKKELDLVKFLKKMRLY